MRREYLHSDGNTFIYAIAIFIVLCSYIGYATASVMISPVIILVTLILPGIFLLHNSEYSYLDKFILVPSVSLSLLAIASLIIPLSGHFDLISAPVESPLVLISVTSLPAISSLIYWCRVNNSGSNHLVNATRKNKFNVITFLKSRITLKSWLITPPLLIISVVTGSVIQNILSITIQNFVITSILVLLIPIYMVSAETELQSGIYIYSLSLSLLLSHTLVTNNVVGLDANYSLYIIDTVLSDGNWTLRSNLVTSINPRTDITNFVAVAKLQYKHSILPVIIGPPIVLHQIGNIDPDYVFKILYAAVFATVPVGIFRISRSYLSINEAFTGAMLFAVYYRFFHIVPAKQHMAQFFLISLLIVWYVGSANSYRKFLATLFMFGIVFSHYAISFILITVFVFSYLCLHVCGKKSVANISGYFTTTFTVVVLWWYLFVTRGIIFSKGVSAAVGAIMQIITTSSSDRSGVSVASEQTVVVDIINLSLHGVLLISLALGVVFLIHQLVSNNTTVFSDEVDVMSIPLLGLVLISVFASGWLGVDRALGIGLTILAPFGVIGIKMMLRYTPTTVDIIGENQTNIVSVVFVTLLLVFSSGLAYEAAGRPATSAINFHDPPNSVVYTDEEYESASWLLNQRRNNQTIYVGLHARSVFVRIKGQELPNISTYKNSNSELAVNWNHTGYIYIRKSEITEKNYRNTPIHLIQREQVDWLTSEFHTVKESDDVVIIKITTEKSKKANIT